jgi:hypothetical protein
MVLIATRRYDEVEPETTCGRLTVCRGAVAGGDSCEGCEELVGGPVAGGGVVGGEVVREEAVGESVDGVVAAGLPAPGAAAWPGVVWAT